MAASVWKLLDNGASKTDQWQYDTGGNAYGVAVDDSGNVFVAGANNGTYSVWKLTSAGAFVWGYDTGGDAYGIAVDNNGFVYVAGVRNSNKSVWCLDDAGATVSLEWDYDTGANTNRIRWHLSKVYIAGCQVADGDDWEQVWCLDDEGNEEWIYKDSNNGIARDVRVGHGGVHVARLANGAVGAYLRLDLAGNKTCWGTLTWTQAFGVVPEGGMTKITTDSGIKKEQFLDDTGIIKTQRVYDVAFVCYGVGGAQTYYHSIYSSPGSGFCYSGTGQGSCGSVPSLAGLAIDKLRGGNSLYVCQTGATAMRKFDITWAADVGSCTYRWGLTANNGRDVCVDPDNYVYVVGDRV